jgi:hypothetical protein
MLRQSRDDEAVRIKAEVFGRVAIDAIDGKIEHINLELPLPNACASFLSTTE